MAKALSARKKTVSHSAPPLALVRAVQGIRDQIQKVEEKMAPSPIVFLHLKKFQELGLHRSLPLLLT